MMLFLLFRHFRRCIASFLMLEYSVAITPTALQQFREIIRYIRNDLAMPRAAEYLFNEISRGIANLSSMPKRFHVVDIQAFNSSEIRRMNIRRYSFFYLVDDSKLQVNIFAIFYGSPTNDRLQRVFKSSFRQK